MGRRDRFTSGTRAGDQQSADSHKHNHGTHFSNPWPSAHSSWSQTLEARLPFELVTDHHHDSKPTQVVTPDFDKELADHSQLHAVWLGHAGFLIQLPLVEGASRPLRLLFDPMFSNRASPVHWIGPSRRLPAPCKIEELPEIDFVFVSHSHYDHLDHHTIKHAFRSCAKRATFCAPLGLASWFSDCHIPDEQILELDWWDTRSISLSQLFSSATRSLSGHLQVACVPAQHGSGRTLTDQATTLWCGWTVEQAYDAKVAKVYHAGDTGYRAHPQGDVCPAFKEIGDRFGPFDISMIPIWRGASLSFLSYLGVRLSPEAFTQAHHCTPADAVSIHKDVQSRHSLAMHFATFAGSEDEAGWPVDLLLRARLADGVPDFNEEGGFGCIDVGATASITPGKQEKKPGKDML